MAKETFLIKSAFRSRLPTESGVYVFRSEPGEALYIGKAKNLKARVSSYFSTELGDKTLKMVAGSFTVETLTTGSEFEAILLEAKLINMFKPKYNIELRDDKSPIYIRLSKDKYPILTSVRKSSLSSTDTVWGPFLSSNETRTILKAIRKLFPFADHHLGKRPCIYSQIGLCNPCPNLIESLTNQQTKASLTKVYRHNIFQVKQTLDGKLTKVRKLLKQEMETAAKKLEFEKANSVKQKLVLFENLTKRSLGHFDYFENPNLREDIAAKEVHELKKILTDNMIMVQKLNRIECFDVSHLSGTSPAASMVVFTSGIADKSSYKRFKIRSGKTTSDFDSIQEVISRRVKNLTNWGKPDLIIVDGGKPQVTAAKKVLKDVVPVIGIAKRFETLVLPRNGKFTQIKLSGAALNLVQRLRDEAHRFAQSYHHKLVEMLIKNVH